MTETNGLQTIVEHAGTLGGLESAPVREDFETEREYEVARQAFEHRQHWTFKRDTPTGTPEPPDTP